MRQPVKLRLFSINISFSRFVSSKREAQSTSTEKTLEFPKLDTEAESANLGNKETVPGGVVDIEEDEQRKALSATYETISDISRLKSWHRKLLHKEITPPNEFKWQSERWALKERYAKYGRASGVDPGAMWPTDDELKEKEAEEKEWSPQLYTTLREIAAKRSAESEMRKAQEKRMVENVAKYARHVEEYRTKLRAKRDAVEEAEAIKREKVQEIQDYFGYAMDESDPRFVAMLRKKEAEERKAKRLAKKQEKESQTLEKLHAMTRTLSQAQQQQQQLASEESSRKQDSTESKP